MYMWMGLLLLSDCRNSSWAITRLATVSSICADEQMKVRLQALQNPV